MNLKLYKTCRLKKKKKKEKEKRVCKQQSLRYTFRSKYLWSQEVRMHRAWLTAMVIYMLGNQVLIVLNSGKQLDFTILHLLKFLLYYFYFLVLKLLDVM